MSPLSPYILYFQFLLLCWKRISFYVECYQKSLSLSRHRDFVTYSMTHVGIVLSTAEQGINTSMSDHFRLLTSRISCTVQSVEHNGCLNFDSLGETSDILMTLY